MTAYRNHLPQAQGHTLLTDGGLETTLIFENGFDLPEFASFPLIDSERGRDALRAYYRRYAEVAAGQGVGIVLDTPTWRASTDWGVVLGYDREELARINRAAVQLVEEIRREFEPGGTPVVISGNIGPRGDGYDPGELMSAAEATAFHAAQISTFAETNADLVTALTMTSVDEAIGVARGAAAHDMPAVISFTVETDGNLPTGQPLGEAITQVDAATQGAPVAFGVNCAHPDHFSGTFERGGDWVNRIGLVRANASRMSHEELDNAEELDAGDRNELAQLYAELRTLAPGLRVLGGCCGTDHDHIHEIGRACMAPVGA